MWFLVWIVAMCLKVFNPVVVTTGFAGLCIRSTRFGKCTYITLGMNWFRNFSIMLLFWLADSTLVYSSYGWVIIAQINKNNNEEEFLEFPNSIWWCLSPEKREFFCDRINRCMASEQVETRDHFLSWLPLWVLLRRKLANYIISLSRLSDTLVVEIVWTWFCINDPLPVSLLGGLNCFVSLGMKLSCSRSQRSWWEEMSVPYFSYIMIW